MFLSVAVSSRSAAMRWVSSVGSKRQSVTCPVALWAGSGMKLFIMIIYSVGSRYICVKIFQHCHPLYIVGENSFSAFSLRYCWAAPSSSC